MATLTTAVTATDAFLTVSNPAQNLAQGTLFRIDDEVLAFDSYGGDNRPGHRDYNTWFVYRGQNHSVAAAHAQGATVQAAVDAFLAGTFGDPPGPFDGGAGGDFDIPGLPALATPDDADELPIEDVSAAVTKKVTVADLLAGASGGTSVAAATLTAAQIKALHASPVEIAAAPGPGRAYMVVKVMTQAVPGATPFTIPGSARLEVGGEDQVLNDYSTWETPLNASGEQALNGTGDGSTITLWVQNDTPTSWSFFPPALIDNQPLVIGNPGAEFTDGNGTLKVYVVYAIVDLA